jgi:hypothetical protein
MKRLLLAFFLTFFAIAGFGQQFSQYNTGTLYESFENPSVRAFIPDSSKMFATNYFIPSFNFNFFLAGNAKEAARTRLFQDYYNVADLQVGAGKVNHIGASLSNYDLMFKMFSSFDGNVELGFFLATKAEARGVATDETASLFNGSGQFPNNTYNNIFNDNMMYQVYQSIGVTYREQLSNRLSFGAKLSALSGVAAYKLEIDQSQINFDKPNDAADIYLAGKSYQSDGGSQSFGKTLLPTFKNPGLAVTVGTSLKTDDGFLIQTNVKDLGFIHWTSNSSIFTFSNFGALYPTTITGLSTSNRENEIINKATSLTGGTVYRQTGSFTTPINGLFELSANKNYWLGGDEKIRFSPTLILSKELFYDGFTGAFVAPFHLSKYSVTLTSSYNNYQMFSFGGQFMIKTPNTDFFIGSESLLQSARVLKGAFTSSTSVTQPQFPVGAGGFMGFNYFVGISFKFGEVIEPNMNSSHVPNGEKGFLGKIFEKIFTSDPMRSLGN